MRFRLSSTVTVPSGSLRKLTIDGVNDEFECEFKRGTYTLKELTFFVVFF